MNKNETGFTSAMLIFNWIEYSVFSTMLILSLLIGVYYGWFKKQDSVAEYLLGGKKMSVFPVTMSLVFSHISGLTLLGVPAEVYSYGTQYAATFLCNITILFSVIYLFLPVFFELQLNSLYEYLELRFNQTTRTLGSLIFAISLVIFIPVVIYIPAMAFNQVTGVSVHVISPIVSFICIFYTSFGGLKAVVWTDALQGVFTLGAIIFVFILGLSKIGGYSEVWRINDEGGRLELFTMNPSPFERNTFWTMSIGTLFYWLPSVAIHPGAVQRFIAVSTFKEAKMVMFWAFIGFTIIPFLVLNIGMVLYATYHGCDPVAIKLVSRTGQILPYYVMNVGKDYPGLTGLFISGVLSAALSTMSAGLNTVAGTLYEDFVQFVLGGRKQTEIQQNFTLKIIVLGLGILCTVLVFVVERLGAIYQMGMSLQGVANGALVGLFTMGLFFPRANAKGAISGAITSLVMMSIIVFGAQYYIAQGLLRFPGKVTSVDGCPANFTASLGFNASARVQTYTGIGSPVVADESVPLIFQISYLYYSLMGALLVLLVGLPVSYLTESPDIASLDPGLFSPPVRRFLPKRPTVLFKPPMEAYTLVSTDPNLKEVTKEDVKEINNESQITGA